MHDGQRIFIDAWDDFEMHHMLNSVVIGDTTTKPTAIHTLHVVNERD